MAKTSQTTLRAGQNPARRKPKADLPSRNRVPLEADRRRKAGTSAPRKAGSHPSVQQESGVTQFALYVSPARTMVCVPAQAPTLFSLQVAADLTGVHPEMLRYYCRLGLLGVDRAEREYEPTFDEEAVYEVRRIEHYRRHLAVSRRALPLICELRREAERQHIEIHFLRTP
jgi:hypothetical protein